MRQSRLRTLGQWQTVGLASGDPTIGNLTSAALMGTPTAGWSWRYQGTESGRHLGYKENGLFTITMENATTEFGATETAPYFEWELPDLPVADWFRYIVQAELDVVTNPDVSNNAVALAIGTGVGKYGGGRMRSDGAGGHHHDRISHSALSAVLTSKSGDTGLLEVAISGTNSGNTGDEGTTRSRTGSTSQGGYNGLAVPTTGLVLIVAYKALATGGTVEFRPPRYRILDAWRR